MIFLYPNKYKERIAKSLRKVFIRVVITLCIFNIFSAIVLFGFTTEPYVKEIIYGLNSVSLFVFFFYLLFDFFTEFSLKTLKRKSRYLWVFIPYFLFLLGHIPEFGIFNTHMYKLLLVNISSIAFLAKFVIEMVTKRMNPFLLMSLSFFFLIAAGTCLLLLPRSTAEDIRFIDSLFIATSAVCVTGLTPLNIAEVFTHQGQLVLMLLIQIGGLGVMTITSFFGVFFGGATSISTQYKLNHILNADIMGSLLKMLLYVFGITLILEGVGALLIWFSVGSSLNLPMDETFFFCIFHSISAFCNAGFSTLPDGMSSTALIHNGSLYWILSGLIFFGGIGFPILANFVQSLFSRISKFFKFNSINSPKSKFGYMNLNSKIIVSLSLILLISGGLLILLLEWNNNLAHFPVFDKITHAFFLSASSRTAGFNNMDIGLLSFPTIFILIVLMWIGGGAQSTAGGIKVNVLAVALYTVRSILKGKSYIEMKNYEIENTSILRAFATVFISILLLIVSVFILLCIEHDMSFISIVFECMSAMTTTGLSMNITPYLEQGSKLVLIGLMFIGRIGFLSFFMGIVKLQKSTNYRLPVTNIIIN